LPTRYIDLFEQWSVPGSLPQPMCHL
jgi:hypothetical protein